MRLKVELFGDAASLVRADASYLCRNYPFVICTYVAE